MKLKDIFGSLSVNNMSVNFKRYQAKVGIIGVGYVGRALVEGLLSSGFRVTGFDLDFSKTLQISHPLFTAAASPKNLKDADVICICVPTPIDKEGKPDLTFLIKACESIADLNSKKRLIVIESTVAPSTLRNVVLPIFSKNGRKCGVDFYLAISPERIDPGNPKFDIRNTPKVVGGIDEVSTKLAADFYSSFVEKVVITSTPETAELSKMLENTFRLVNISLINEIKEYADLVGINIWEVIDAAATKPFGFLPHYPGPGVGGHCIPVDPVYLLEEAKSKGLRLNIIEKALDLNKTLPKKIVQKARKALNGHATNLSPKMLVIGIAYKPDIDDTRESPSVQILKEAEEDGFEVSYFDPHVPKLNGYTSKLLTPELLVEQDVIVIATHHKNVPYDMLTQVNKPIIDTRNILNQFNSSKVLHWEEEAS